MSYKWTIKNALKEDRGSTTYQVAARVNLPPSMVSKALSKMYLAGEIERVETGNPALAFFEYKLKKSPVTVKIDAPQESTFHQQNYAAMAHRVVLLKKMRDRLIEEYHPLLNAVIADYEQFILPSKQGSTEKRSV